MPASLFVVLERVWKIIPTNWDTHLAESIFQTYSGKIILLKVREDNIKKWNKKMLRLFLTSREQKKKIKNAQSRNRTSDTRIFSPLLYQLSYLGIDYKSLSCGSRIWTCDLRVMSPTSFQTAPSRDIKLISQKRKADDRTRTDNLLITNQLLCQLSHIGL